MDPNKNPNLVYLNRKLFDFGSALIEVASAEVYALLRAILD